MKIMSANSIAPYGMPRFAASHLGLFCLPMSHRPGLYTRLIWVNISGSTNNCLLLFLGVTLAGVKSSKSVLFCYTHQHGGAQFMVSCHGYILPKGYLCFVCVTDHILKQVL